MQLKSLGNLSIALKVIKAAPKDFNAVSDAVKKLSNQNTVTALTTSALSKQQQLQILINKGLSAEEANMALKTATLSASQTTATTTTGGLTAAMKGLGVAIKTNPIFWIIGTGIGIYAVIKAFDYFTISTEEALKSADEAREKIKSFNDTYTSHRKVVEDTASVYDELSKGIDKTTNKNISLSTEDYDKFLDINNQLAEAFPQLIATIDENGNAILNLGKNGRNATEDLKELLTAEEGLQNFKISQEISNVFGGVKATVNKALENQEKYNTELKNTEGALKRIRDVSYEEFNIEESIEFSGDMSNKGDLNYLNVIYPAIEKFRNQLSTERFNDLYGDILEFNPVQQNPDESAFDFYFDTSKLTTEEKEKLSSLILEQSDYMATILSDSLNTSMQNQALNTKEAELAWKDFIPTLVATMKSKGSFKELDETTQKLAIHMVEGLQMDTAALISENNPYEYIRNNVVLPLTNLTDNELKDLSNTYNQLFSFDSDGLSVNETKAQIDEYIQTIADILGQDPLELKIQLGFSDIDSLVQNYATIMQNAAEKFSGQSSLSLVKGGDKKYETEYSKLEKFAKANGINTQNEIAFWNKCIEESKTREEAMKKYLENSNGKTESQLSFLETFDKLDEMTDAFTTLDGVYANFIDKKKEITFDDLSALSEKFKDVSGISTYIKAIQKARGNTEATQDAFNNLTSAYIEHTGILDQVNEGNASLIQSYLQEQGITNAEILVQNALAKNLDMIAAQKWYVVNATIDLSNATYDEIQALIDEADYAGVAKGALIKLVAQKIVANSTALTTNGDIENLKALARQAGATAAAVNKLKTGADGVAGSAGAGKGRLYSNNPDKAKNDLLGLINDTVDADYGSGTATNTVSYGGGSKSNKSGGKDSKSKEPTEFDWMQRKIEIIDSQVDKLKDNIESLVGYKNKNSMTDTAIDRLTNKMSILQQMHDKYMESANKLGLSQEYIDKIQNGNIEIESIGDEDLANVIKEYQDLFDKSQDANNQILETKEAIYDLNLSKLDNITDQYEQLLDVQEQIVDTEKQLIDLREKSGEEIYTDDYISLADKQLDLVRQNADAYNSLAAEMVKMNLKEGSEDWKKYNDQLQDYKNNMISAADAVEQYKDTMTDLVYKSLNDFKSAMDSINGTISTMNDLIGNNNLIDEFGNLTDRGLAHVALYAHQMSNAKQEAAEYAEAIESLDDALDSGLITQDEYNSMLYDYKSAQEDAIRSSKEARDAIISLVKDGIQSEINAKKKLVDETKAALDAEKDLHDYQNSIAEKQDNISKLERQIAAFSNSTEKNEIAQRLQLQNQLANAKKELYELQYDHEIEQRKKALDDEYNNFEESKQKESDELESNLDAQDAAINRYLEQVKKNYSTVYGVLNQYGDEYSLAAIEDLTTPWESSNEAANLCSDAIGEAIANIQYEINGLDFSPLYELVELLNQIGANGYGEDSSLAQFNDITGTGKWQKGQGGKWWYGEDYNPNGAYDYASDGIYTINGKQYGFNDDGYMITGWNDDFGDWRYFEPENGEMVKSQWRKDRKGEWYYLDKNGVMATDIAVKAKEGNGYYYLDGDGKWNGQTLSSEQVRKLGYTIGYKYGTLSARKGWNLMDENGVGSEAFMTDKGILRQFDGGETVFNSDMTEKLWKFAKDPTKFISGLSGINNTLDLSKLHPVSCVSINSPLVQIDGTGLSANEVSAIIKNETRDIDKRVAKSIKYELMGK